MSCILALTPIYCNNQGSCLCEPGKVTLCGQNEWPQGSMTSHVFCAALAPGCLSPANNKGKAYGVTVAEWPPGRREGKMAVGKPARLSSSPAV